MDDCYLLDDYDEFGRIKEEDHGRCCERCGDQMFCKCINTICYSTGMMKKYEVWCCGCGEKIIREVEE